MCVLYRHLQVSDLTEILKAVLYLNERNHNFAIFKVTILAKCLL